MQKLILVLIVPILKMTQVQFENVHREIPSKPQSVEHFYGLVKKSHV